ncbi:MAG: tyrosine-type recombinase/integrase [Gemmatimonadaceae bacterium]
MPPVPAFARLALPAGSPLERPAALVLVPDEGHALRPSVPNASTARAPGPLLEVWLAGLAPRSRQTYRQHVMAFARWMGVALEALPAALLDRGPGPAHALARQYRGALLDRGLAPATVNSALGALRSLSRVARATDRIDWALEVRRVRVIPYRNTAGPGRDAVRALLAAAARHRNPRRAAQGVAVLRMLHDLALRCTELASLHTTPDIEYAADGTPVAVHVRGKGLAGARTRLPLPDPTAVALGTWLAVRGHAPGPALLLTERGVAKVMERLSRKAGIPRVAPAQLRHQAITGALNAGWDVRRVREFSRHAHIETVMIYDDNRRGVGAAVAGAVADLL